MLCTIATEYGTPELLWKRVPDIAPRGAVMIDGVVYGQVHEACGLPPDASSPWRWNVTPLGPGEGRSYHGACPTKREAVDAVERVLRSEGPGTEAYRAGWRTIRERTRRAVAT